MLVEEGVLRAMGKQTKRKIGISITMRAVVVLGVSIMSSATRAQDDGSRFTYVRVHCTPDNESHFADVTVDLNKENFAPPAAPIAIGGNQQVSRAFIAGFEAHWGAVDLNTHLNHPLLQSSYSLCSVVYSRLPPRMARRGSYILVT